MTYIPFNRAFFTGRELDYVREAVDRAHLAADGEFTARCRSWLEGRIGSEQALLVHSCTAALELSALLLDVGLGDEVVMPSFTFVTTANAFVLRGATPVFVDIRPDTLNLDEALLDDAITPRTKAVVPVHYAGVGAEMDSILAVADARGVTVVEDAAQGVCASYRDRPLGGMGALGAVSFHETKNVTCGEGGAVLVNDPDLAERAEILREKGTDRSRFCRGQVDKYTWVDLGSSYALSDLAAAFLWAQLEQADRITARRLEIWERYHEAFEGIEQAGIARRPVVPAECRHNAHLYYLLLDHVLDRRAFLAELARRQVNAVFHYVPLHTSPAGARFGRAHGELPVTDSASERLVRLPLWAGMAEREVEQVIEAVLAAAGVRVRRLQPTSPVI